MMGDIMAECAADPDRWAPIAEILRETVMKEVSGGEVPDLIKRAGKAGNGTIMKQIAECWSREDSAGLLSGVMESVGGGGESAMAAAAGQAIADGLCAVVRDRHDLRAFGALSESQFEKAYARIMNEQSRGALLFGKPKAEAEA